MLFRDNNTPDVTKLEKTIIKVLLLALGIFYYFRYLK